MGKFRPASRGTCLPLLLAGAFCVPLPALVPGDGGPEGPAIFVCLARPTCSAVADALELRVAGSRQLEPAARLGALVAAAESAAGRLSGQRAGDLLAKRALAARWEGLVDRIAAADALREDLTRWVSDLRFRAVVEAELPPGFPAQPTPIHGSEVRSYPSYRMAQANLGERGGQGAFWSLFERIQRHGVDGVAMTAPVETPYGVGGLARGQA